MLLYVNKKAIRQKQIRITLIIIATILFILANIICFTHTFHTSSKTPNNYISIKKEPLFIESYPVVEQYITNKNQTKQILIPKTLTKQASHKLAQILKHKDIKSVFLTKELQNNLILHDIINFFNLTISDTITPKTIVISSDIKLLTPAIYQQKLLPQTTMYKEFNNPNFKKLINQHFPTKELPTDTLSKKAVSLNNFVTDYKQELINLTKHKQLTEQKFSHQEAMLQNIDFCIKTTHNTFCNIDTKKSFAKKISETLKNIPQDQNIQTLILLTSFEETTSQKIAQDCGLLFKFNNRSAILLPNEITPNAFNDIKIKTGINPQYSNDAMKFYQFKTVEINLNDNI